MPSMRETRFIEQNKEKWREFESGFASSKTDPEKLTNLFVQITDDLSYARTYYPNRSVRLYLNKIAQQVYFAVYKNRVRQSRKFIEFWKEELPEVMYRSRRELFFSLALFLLALGIGVFSSIHDGEFARQILGDRYIEMTEENIANGDPMKVYKVSSGGDMFLGITINNLKVAFFCFLLGLSFGLGTAVFILFNGIMIGAFQYFFIERELFWESFLTIWIHGAMEISAIVIAGAAGFALGRSLLFPGTYSRAVSFRIGAVKAIKIFIGITPIIVIAGFLESYFTRHTDVPDLVRGAIIAAEFFFMAVYYVIYPARKARKGFALHTRPDEVYPLPPVQITFDRIKKDGEVFSESFNLFRLFAHNLWLPVLLVMAMVTGTFIYLEGIHNLNSSRWVFAELGDIFFFYLHPILLPVCGVAFSLVLALPIWMTLQYRQGQPSDIRLKTVFRQFPNKSWPIIFLLTTAWLALMYLPSPGTVSVFLLLITFPLLCFILTAYLWKQTGESSISPFQIISYNFGGLLFLLFSQLLTGFVLLGITDSGITYFHLELIKWNVPFNPVIYKAISEVLMISFMMFGVFILTALFSFGMVLFFFSNAEAITAHGLSQKIKEILG